MLKLTSCERVREPGMAASVARELARRYARGDADIFPCLRINCDEHVIDLNMSTVEKAVIIVALREYANG